MSRDNFPLSSRRGVLKGIAAASVTSGLAGCSQGNEETTQPDDGGTDGESNFGVSGPFADSITGLTWNGWDVPSVTGVFEEETGLSVSADNIGTDLDGFNKIKGGAEYEFICPDNVWVQRLGEAGLAQKIDEDLFADELAAMPEVLRDHPTMFYDGDRYGLPPRWGVMGLLYNKEEISESEAQSRAVFFDSDYEGRTEVMNWPLWTGPQVALHLIDTGEISVDEVTAENVYGIGDDDMQKVQEAMTQMIQTARLLPNTTSEAHRPLLDETVYVSNGFLLDYVQIKEIERTLGTDKIGFVPNPGQGGIFWVEGLAITSKADTEEKVNTANAFFKWALSKQGQANIAWTELRKAGPTNQEATSLLSDRQNELLHIDQMEDIASNAIDYLPSQTDKWVNAWEKAKENA